MPINNKKAIIVTWLILIINLITIIAATAAEIRTISITIMPMTSQKHQLNHNLNKKKSLCMKLI